MNRFLVSPLAKQDLEDIWEYIGISNDNPTAADRVIERFFEQFRQLAATPRIGQMCDQIRLGLRRFPVGNYVIFYSHEASGLQVERILHGARDIDALFADDETGSP